MTTFKGDTFCDCESLHSTKMLKAVDFDQREKGEKVKLKKSQREKTQKERVCVMKKKDKSLLLHVFHGDVVFVSSNLICSFHYS